MRHHSSPCARSAPTSPSPNKQPQALDCCEPSPLSLRTECAYKPPPNKQAPDTRRSVLAPSLPTPASSSRRDDSSQPVVELGTSDTTGNHTLQIRTPAGVPACNRWLSNATPPDYRPQPTTHPHPIPSIPSIPSISSIPSIQPIPTAARSFPPAASTAKSPPSRNPPASRGRAKSRATHTLPTTSPSPKAQPKSPSNPRLRCNNAL